MAIHSKTVILRRMSIFAHFQAISDNSKTALVRKLMESSTPDFDFFYLVGLSVLMATFGLILDNGTIVIGSMLIAPLMYPILGVSLGLVMSNGDVLGRSASTLFKSLAIGFGLATLAAFFFGHESMASSAEVLARTHPSYIYVLVSIIAGAAVSFALAQPEWSETLPGIAISVALIPPLAAVGVGVAAQDLMIIKGSSVLLLLNIVGIIGAASASFMMMNLYQKQNIAEATIKRENERIEVEKAVMQEIDQTKAKNENQTVS